MSRNGMLRLRSCLASSGIRIDRVAGVELLGQHDLEPGGDRNGHERAYQAEHRAADQAGQRTAAALRLTVCRRMRGAMR